MNTLKQKKLVVEFMEVKEVQTSYDSYGNLLPIYKASNEFYSTSVYDKPGTALEQFIIDSKYDSSWDWLMPVVNKIRGTYNSGEITMTEESVSIIDDLAEGCIEANIIQVYEAVLKFIEWYNTQNKVNFFKIDGFWKDDKTKFSDHIVSSGEYQENTEDNGDDQIFFYGLSEEDIKEAIEKKWGTDLEFVITSYSKI